MADALYDQELEEKFWNGKDSLFRVKNYYKELSADKNYNFFQIVFQPLGIEDFMGSEPFYDNYERGADVHRSDYVKDNKTYNVVKNAMISSNVMEEFGFRVCEGRLLKEDDFILSKGKTRIPILLGYEYKDYYKVGDILKGHYYSSNTVWIIPVGLKRNICKPSNFGRFYYCK
jgi:hypothetical protein